MARKPRRYSIAYLLGKQSAGFRKHPEYSMLIRRFDISPVIKRLRITGRCYRILNNASVPASNLKSFYRTYRLPNDMFFPLFINIKRTVLDDKAKRRIEREKWIRNETEKYPRHIAKSLAELKRYEKKLHRSGLSPEWDRVFIPSTKKRVRELLHGDAEDWTGLFNAYIEKIEERYGRTKLSTSGREKGITGGDLLLALSVLELPFSLENAARPPARTVNERFRLLSKKHHPDLGGDEAYFILLKQAKDILS